jgi:hypothetical protein
MVGFRLDSFSISTSHEKPSNDKKMFMDMLHAQPDIYE